MFCYYVTVKSRHNVLLAPQFPYCRPRLSHQDVAQSMAAFFQKVFMDEATFGEHQHQHPLSTDKHFVADGKETWSSMSLVDLAANLMNETSTCEELGHQAFSFFKASVSYCAVHTRGFVFFVDHHPL